MGSGQEMAPEAPPASQPDVPQQSQEVGRLSELKFKIKDSVLGLKT